MSTKYGVNSFSLVGSYRCDIWDICHTGIEGTGEGGGCFWNMRGSLSVFILTCRYVGRKKQLY